MVDTGATTVAMGQAEAERIGLDYKNGRRGMTQHRQRRDAGLPRHARLGAHRRRPGLQRRGRRCCPRRCRYVLLGNSFLDPLPDAARERRMTLDQRY